MSYICAIVTRQKIIDSAILILNEDYSAPLEKIAGKAGISRRTLHRYFDDRQSLVDACVNDMMHTWQNAMLTAYNDYKDPVEQLEHMLYAGIDCGVKYAFVNKLRVKPSELQPPQAQENTAYTLARDKWLAIIPKLQRQKIISKKLSTTWIRILFANIITTTIEAMQSGDIALNYVKPLAWYSFRRGIGMD